MQKRSPASIAALFAVGAVVAFALCLVAAVAVVLMSMRGSSGGVITPAEQAARPTPIPAIQPSATPVIPSAGLVMSDELLQGVGDSVVKINKIGGATLLIVSYAGEGFFSVETVDINNRVGRTLIITTDAYSGTVLIDSGRGEESARLKVTAKGTWTIKQAELSSAPVLPVPGSATYTGDGVFLLQNTLDTMAISYNSPGFFSVIAHQNERYDTLVVTSSYYKGTVLAPNGTKFIEIRANGPWTVVTTTR